MPLTISMNTASAELTDSRVARCIIDLAARLSLLQRSGVTPAQPSLDVTFMLPGKFDKPDFSGMRMGGYDDSAKILRFEKAVPEHIVHSPQSQQFVDVVIQDVIANAADFFREHNILFDAARWRQALATA